MELHESGQMYLETIHVLLQKQEHVRAIDVGNHLGYSKPSVSRAIGLLKQEGYITVDGDGHIALTASGLAEARRIYERHTVLTAMLTALGVDETTAAEDACRMEHVISDATFAAVKAHLTRHKQN